MTGYLDGFEATIEVRVLTPLMVWTGRTSILGLDSFIIQKGGKNLFLVPSGYCMEAAVRKMVGSGQYAGLQDVARDISQAIKDLLDKDLCKPEIEAEAVTTPQKGPILLGWDHPPETTIKGLIRTAVLTRILANELRGKYQQRVLNDIRRAINNILSMRPKYAAQGLESRLSFKVQQTSFRYDAFQRVNVVFEGSKNATMILDLFEVKELSGRQVAKLNVVAINSESTFKYRLLVTRLSRKVAGIVRQARNFASTSQQLDELDDNVTSCNAIKKSLELYSKLLIESEKNKYKNLDKLLERAGKECIPLKLGLKTGHDSKTITPLLKAPHLLGIPSNIQNQLKSLYRRLAHNLTQIYRRTWDDKTITISNYTAEPVGWICVKLDKCREAQEVTRIT